MSSNISRRYTRVSSFFEKAFVTGVNLRLPILTLEIFGAQMARAYLVHVRHSHDRYFASADTISRT